jgi:hypothetical protein
MPVCYLEDETNTAVIAMLDLAAANSDKIEATLWLKHATLWDVNSGQRIWDAPNKLTGSVHRLAPKPNRARELLAGQPRGQHVLKRFAEMEKRRREEGRA